MLKAIERATGQAIESMEMPSVSDINESRVGKFKQRIVDALGEQKDLSVFYQMIKQIEAERDVDPLQISAALACMVQGDVPLLLKESELPQRQARDFVESDRERKPRKTRDRSVGKELVREAKPLKDYPDIEMQRYRIEVGYEHGVKPGNIVGAIANEAELESKYIGHIEIFDDFATVDLPSGMPKEIFNELKKVWVCRRQLQISRLGDSIQRESSKRDAAGNNPSKRGPKRSKAAKGAIMKKDAPKPHKKRKLKLKSADKQKGKPRAKASKPNS